MDKSKKIGQFFRSSVVGGEHYNTYVPQKLPPDPPLDIGDLLPLLEKAITAIARLTQNQEHFRISNRQDEQSD